jgi:putative ABC transport system permease protein
VLKTLGFGDRTVLFLVLAESLAIAFVGGAFGIGLAKLFTMGGDPTGGFLPVFYLSTGEMIFGITIAVLVGLAAGSIPALTAMNLRIVDALRRV